MFRSHMLRTLGGFAAYAALLVAVGAVMASSFGIVG